MGKIVKITLNQKEKKMYFPKEEFQKYPNQMTKNMVSQLMPDRIFNPNQIEYIFERVSDGLDYTSNYYYRESQTITDKGHVSEEMLSHMAENGIRLVCREII
jgi:hypothetical protein